MVAFSVLLAAFAAAVPSVAAPAIPIERDVALSEHGAENRLDRRAAIHCNQDYTTEEPGTSHLRAPSFLSVGATQMTSS